MKVWKYGFGDMVKDRISGYQGVVVGRHEFITGCDRYSLQSTTLTKDDEPAKQHSFDEVQLDLVEKNAVVLAGAEDGPGGPRDDHGYRHAD